jgi:hypothetical protein
VLVGLALGLGVGGVVSTGWAAGLGLVGLAGWALMTLAFLPAVRFFDLRNAWALTLPVAGVLYGGMTLDSARRHLQGAGNAW